MVTWLILLTLGIPFGVLGYKLVQLAERLVERSERDRQFQADLQRDVRYLSGALRMHLPELMLAIINLADRTNVPQPEVTEAPEEEDNTFSAIAKAKQELLMHHQAGVLPDYMFIAQLRALEAEE